LDKKGKIKMNELKHNVTESLVISVEIPLERIAENRWWTTDGLIHGYIEKIIKDYGYCMNITDTGDIVIFNRVSDFCFIKK
jgi:hypothetical protein